MGYLNEARSLLWFSRPVVIAIETPILLPPDADSFEKTLLLGKIQGRRRRG